MLSKVTLAFSCALAFSLSCDTVDERINDICTKLADCTGFIKNDSSASACPSAIEDALRDRRITATGLTRCATCLAQPSDEVKQTCRDVLDARHCDVACSEVSFVLEARTCGENCRNSRGSACDRLELWCGVVPDVAGCTAEVNASYQGDLQTSLDHDDEVFECATCLLGQSADAAGAGGAAAPVPGLQVNLGACSALIDTCRTPCANVDPISQRLRLSRAALTYCDRVTGCVLTSPSIAAAGGTGSGGAPTRDGSTDGGVGGVSVDRSECYRNRLAQASLQGEALIDCADCADQSLDCDALVKSCDACREVQ